jgi:SAM-dependent methyltransferase
MREPDAKDHAKPFTYELFKGRADFEAWRRIAKEVGLQGACKQALAKLARRLRWLLSYHYNTPFDRAFDRKHGINTCGVSILPDLTIDSQNRRSGLEYEATPVRAFLRMLAGLPKDLREFVFVDFGSGKGRTLLLASHRNFKQVVGVEFAEELHQAAEANIAAYRSERQICRDVRSVLTDAVLFPIPDAPCVFYFYYPFRKEVMSKVLNNIRSSYLARPRRMFFINRLDQTSWAEECTRLFGAMDFLRPAVGAPGQTRLGLSTPYKVLLYEASG